jgi:hypothetical protein
MSQQFRRLAMPLSKPSFDNYLFLEKSKQSTVKEVRVPLVSIPMEFCPSMSIDADELKRAKQNVHLYRLKCLITSITKTSIQLKKTYDKA